MRPDRSTVIMLCLRLILLHWFGSQYTAVEVTTNTSSVYMVCLKPTFCAGLVLGNVMKVETNIFQVSIFYLKFLYWSDSWCTAMEAGTFNTLFETCLCVSFIPGSVMEERGSTLAVWHISVWVTALRACWRQTRRHLDWATEPLSQR